MGTNKKAFTFIEVMIVVAIVVIMTVALLVALDGKPRGQQEVQSAGRLLEVAIREAQNNALNGVNAVNVCGYGISVAKSNGTITRYHQNKDGGGNCPANKALSANVSDRTETVGRVTVSNANPSDADDPYVFFAVPFGAMTDNSTGIANFQFASIRDASVIFTVCSSQNKITDGMGNAGAICT